MFKENEFRAQMVRAGITHKELAKRLEINESTLYRKIQNDGSFTREEIAKIIAILDIGNPNEIFFAE